MKSAKQSRGANSGHLEDPFVTAPVHTETLDGNGESRAFSLAHFCEPTVVEDPSDDHFLSNGIGAGYDAALFTYLGKQQQTPLPEFVL